MYKSIFTENGQFYLAVNAATTDEMVNEILKHQERHSYSPRTLINYKLDGDRLTIRYRGSTDTEYEGTYRVE